MPEDAFAVVVRTAAAVPSATARVLDEAGHMAHIDNHDRGWRRSRPSSIAGRPHTDVVG